MNFQNAIQNLIYHVPVCIVDISDRIPDNLFNYDIFNVMTYSQY